MIFHRTFMSHTKYLMNLKKISLNTLTLRSALLPAFFATNLQNFRGLQMAAAHIRLYLLALFVLRHLIDICLAPNWQHV